jgi:hypothetical protein
LCNPSWLLEGEDQLGVGRETTCSGVLERAFVEKEILDKNKGGPP